MPVEATLPGVDRGQGLAIGYAMLFKILFHWIK